MKIKTRQDKTRQDKTRQDKTRQDKTILLLVASLSLLFFATSQTAWGEVRLEEVPKDWDFGTYIYNKNSSTSQTPNGIWYGDGANGGDGDKNCGIRWTDTENISGQETLRIYAKIVSISPSENKLGYGHLDMRIGQCNATSAGMPNHREPPERNDSGEDSRWAANSWQWKKDQRYDGGLYAMYFDPAKRPAGTAERTWVAGPDRTPTAQAIYKKWKKDGNGNFYIPINAVQVTIPPGCSYGKKSLTINWDIEIAP